MCVCREADDSNGLVRCQNCNEYYHCDCVGLVDDGTKTGKRRLQVCFKVLAVLHLDGKFFVALESLIPTRLIIALLELVLLFFSTEHLPANAETEEAVRVYPVLRPRQHALRPPRHV